ncbi:acyl-CoA-binding domain-containing protein 4 isoform X2 [Microtus oregoni]|uniref:acyl-CoA-binding domain-containing protein 4 isoform X2 n=1 Tax=Microtus oregoni TaxID=111838 RepID=UPI001BB16054|nr:acyl-CoA-binding domain-containing protein 4 isoform X2 [Microtus oregoni]
MALTAPPMKRCCGSTATTNRLPWGPAWSPGLGSGIPLDVISGVRFHVSYPLISFGKSRFCCPLSQVCLILTDARWRTLPAQVIDTVPLGEVAEDMFGYFEPLYQVIPDMPRPPDTFLRRVTGWKEPALHRDDQTAPEPSCLPKEPVPPSPEPQPPRDLDLEVFCDSLEQLEPELVRPSLFSPVPPGSELPRLHPETCDSAQQVCSEQKAAAGRELDTGGNPESPSEKKGLEGSLMGPQELDKWLVGTVRAMQESMRNVQRRLQSLESKSQPREQRPPRTRPWPLGLSAPTLLFFILWPFVVQWLFRQFRTQKR